MGKCVTEVFSRVTGFFRPVRDWNPGKGVKGEFTDRKKFDKAILDFAEKTSQNDKDV